MHLLLFEPEIPPNTGNIARLCAATGSELHLVEPLGFSLEDRYLKRAGLDYWPHVSLSVWPNLRKYLDTHGMARRLVMTSARCTTPLQHFTFERLDTLVFGPETRGLPKDVLALSPHCLRIPTIPGTVRSLNLSTAAGIVLYQALSKTGQLDQNPFRD